MVRRVFATLSLVIFVTRTRRVPFFRSKPSTPLLATPVVRAATGALLLFAPLARVFGFVPLLASFLGILGLMVATCLTLVEFGKKRLFRPIAGAPPVSVPRSPQRRRICRVATRWSTRPGSPPALEAAVAADGRSGLPNPARADRVEPHRAAHRATDVPLELEGVRGAELIGVRFKEERFAVVLSSPLSRALDTCVASPTRSMPGPLGVAMLAR